MNYEERLEENKRIAFEDKKRAIGVLAPRMASQMNYRKQVHAPKEQYCCDAKEFVEKNKDLIKSALGIKDPAPAPTYASKSRYSRADRGTMIPVFLNAGMWS